MAFDFLTGTTGVIDKRLFNERDVTLIAFRALFINLRVCDVKQMAQNASRLLLANEIMAAPELINFQFSKESGLVRRTNPRELFATIESESIVTILSHVSPGSLRC